MKQKKKHKGKTTKRVQVSIRGSSPVTRIKDGNMGIYTEYLDKQFNSQQLNQERQKQLLRISKLRNNRDVLVIAADLNKGKAPISIDYSDLMAVNDQLTSLNGTAIDLILETPGGSGEIAEDIVRLLHGKYNEVGIIVPGYAKSAGTIIAMAGDEILMEPASALGPIDAQISWQGKTFSADAFLEGMDKIKEEVENTGVLNKAYIPILQALSPGEIQSAENALKFAKTLVTDWLAHYKFKDWSIHSSTGEPVTDADRTARAEEIATKLCNHRYWLTHGRSIKIKDLTDMKLRITDYSAIPDLADAIRRYYTLMQMTFASNVYKIFETPNSQILRLLVPQISNQPAMRLETPTGAENADLELHCPKCNNVLRIQANLGKPHPVKPSFLPFPADNKLSCPNCKAEIDVSAVRRDIEAKAKKPIV
jgi:hypothetical protein